MPSDRRNPRTLVLFVFVVAMAVGLAWILRHALLIIYISAAFAVVLTVNQQVAYEVDIANGIRAMRIIGGMQITAIGAFGFRRRQSVPRPDRRDRKAPTPR